MLVVIEIAVIILMFNTPSMMVLIPEAVENIKDKIESKKEKHDVAIWEDDSE